MVSLIELVPFTHSFGGTPNVTMATVNTTPATDVLINGCVSNFNTIACIRSSVLTFLALLTAVLCVFKVVKLHHAHHQNWHQYFIFYCASLECSIAGVHWVLSLYVQFDFVLQWLKLSQFLVMCHFYWMLATRALRREMWTKRFLLPFLAIACLYFTTVAVLGIVNVQDTSIECFPNSIEPGWTTRMYRLAWLYTDGKVFHAVKEGFMTIVQIKLVSLGTLVSSIVSMKEPYWLMMSSAEFIIVQLFCVAGFYITRRLNEISMLDSVRTSQKRDLWCIVVVFEISALIGVLYDATLRIVGEQSTGCSAIFKHGQEFFSVIYFTFMVAKLLCPVWVMLFVFQPTPQVAAEPDDLVPALTDDMNSAFSTNSDDQYRQLYHPTENYRTLSYDSPTAHSPASGFVAHSPASSRGSVNTVENGITNTAYKSALPNNLGPIREEGDSRQSTPNARNATIRNRNTPAAESNGPAPHGKSVERVSDKQKGKGSVNENQTSSAASHPKQPISESQSHKVEIKDGKSKSQNNHPIKTANQQQRGELVNNRQVVTPNKVVSDRKEAGPTFSITGNSDDSDVESPPPKGKN